ncbi:MAG: hypothetical protein JO296_07985 [Pseudonocardiales bacterium]|nr:hypothetical protein [Pseudonocardiales bacterium]
MNAAELYWAQLYAQAELDARVEEDGTAAPQQDSQLGRQYYYLDDDGDVDS